MATAQVRIDPKAIEAGRITSRASPTAKASSFNSVMGAIDAMGPFARELTYQTSGSANAATVLHTAFTALPAAGASLGGQAPSFAMGYGSLPYAKGSYGGVGGIPGLENQPSYPTTGGTVVPGTNLTQFELLQTMNQNNLQLLELQAIMQSNMQTWNTKSNILSADHRAKMSMIEKFTARG